MLFICDGKNCGEDHNCGECFHTSNIDHAKNFEKTKSGLYIEKPRYKPGSQKQDTGLADGTDINDLP